MDISVIIPIYNTSKYLKECIESVLSIRNADRVEIILINDGSTDNSLEICQEYAIQNKNVIVIDKENEGLAQTRNCGILKARGKYLLFLDSDDYYLRLDNKKSQYEELLTPLSLLFETAELKKLDVLSFNYTRSKNNKPERKVVDYYTGDIYKLVNSNTYTSSACTKLIKKQVLLDNNIFFEKGRLSEDILFSGLLLDVPNANMGFYNEVLYFYRIRNNSITQSITNKNIEDVFYAIKNLAEIKNNIVLSYSGFQYATLMININLSRDKIDKDLSNQIKKYSYLLKYNNSKTIKLIYITSKIIGLQLTSSILSIYFKMKNRSEG